MYQKIIVLCLCMSLAAPSVSVYAAEPERASIKESVQSQKEPMENSSLSEKEEGTELDGNLSEHMGESMDGNLEHMGTDMEGVFEDLKQALDSGKEFQLSASLGNHSGMEIEQGSLFDLSDMQFVTDTALDLGTTNLKYQLLSEQMETEFTSKDVSGKSENSVELFQKTYGDLSKELTLKTPTLPKGFSVSEMLAQGSETIFGMYEEASHSGNFASIKGSISIGNIFTQAKQGLSMPEMSSLDDLSRQMEASSSGITKKANEAYRNQMSNIRDRLKGKNQGLKDSVNKNYLNMVDIDTSFIGMYSKSKTEEKKETMKKEETKKAKKKQKKKNNRDPKLDLLYQNKKK